MKPLSPQEAPQEFLTIHDESEYPTNWTPWSKGVVGQSASVKIPPVYDCHISLAATPIENGLCDNIFSNADTEALTVS